jgi:hypothetical protein
MAWNIPVRFSGAGSPLGGARKFADICSAGYRLGLMLVVFVRSSYKSQLHHEGHEKHEEGQRVIPKIEFTLLAIAKYYATP